LAGIVTAAARDLRGRRHAVNSVACWARSP
jgi:hypothetical protein